MGISGLTQSRWAPASARQGNADYGNLKGSKSNPNLQARRSSGEKRRIAQLQSYQRLLKSMRRLRWKSVTLLFCHQRALMMETSNVICGIDFPISSDSGKANAAEIMFKADFFEYYALLERVIVYLLECFGLAISPDVGNNAVPVPVADQHLNTSNHTATRAAEHSLIGDSMAFHGYPHRFHANVLAALDRPSNPLHPFLGVGRVRQYLGIAKEFRNRWKEVESETTDAEDHIADLHKSYHQILADLKLDEMLAAFLSALDEAKSLASQYLAAAHGSVEVDMIGVDDEDAVAESAMIGDIMDWD